MTFRLTWRGTISVPFLAMTLGARIRSEREGREWSLDDLANLVGVVKSAVAHWEHDRRTPRPRQMRQLAMLFGFTPGDLYSEVV